MLHAGSTSQGEQVFLILIRNVLSSGEIVEDAKAEASSAALRCRNGARVRKIKEYGNSIFYTPVGETYFSQGCQGIPSARFTLSTTGAPCFWDPESK